MSLDEGFGKKSRMESQFMKLPEIDCHLYLNMAKHVCKADKSDVIFDIFDDGNLVKLETFTGPHYRDASGLFYDIYWRVLCTDCSKEFKQLLGSYKVNEAGLDGPNTLRWK